MSNLYYHTFFRWWKPIEIEELSKVLSVNYKTIAHRKDPDQSSVSINKDDRDEIEVISDNMVAFLSRFRATLSQVKDGTLNQKDKELRDIIRDNYPRDRPTPFPWEWNPEPSLN